MDNFIDIFSKIDKNYDDVITKEELEKFTRENHLDKQMVNVSLHYQHVLIWMDVHVYFYW